MLASQFDPQCLPPTPIHEISQYENQSEVDVGFPHDRSAIFHDTKLGADAIEYARGIDIHDEVPVLIRLLHDGIDPDDTGPVSGSVQLSKLLDSLGDPGIHRRAFAHIDNCGEVGRRVFQQLHGLSEAFLVDVGQRDECSSLGQQLRKDTTLARPCSGDGNLPCCQRGEVDLGVVSLIMNRTTFPLKSDMAQQVSLVPG